MPDILFKIGWFLIFSVGIPGTVFLLTKITRIGEK